MGEAKRRSEARAQYEAQPPEHRLGDAPVEAQYHAQMTAIMQTLDEIPQRSQGTRLCQAQRHRDHDVPV